MHHRVNFTTSLSIYRRLAIIGKMVPPRGQRGRRTRWEKDENLGAKQSVDKSNFKKVDGPTG